MYMTVTVKQNVELVEGLVEGLVTAREHALAGGYTLAAREKQGG